MVVQNEQPEHEEVVRPVRYGEVKIIKTPEKKHSQEL